MVGALLQSHSLQGIERFLLIGHAVEVLRQHHVFERREIGNQVELLKHKTNFLRPHSIQFVRGDSRHIFAIEPNLSGSGAVQAADQVHQRRFARSRRAHDRDPLPGIDVQGEIVQRADDAAPLASALGGIQRG